MKKFLSVFALLILVSTMLAMTGCFGDSDSDSGSVSGAGTLLVSVVATGPATAAAFAANAKSPEIRAAAVASTKYVARITPNGRTPVEITSTNVDITTRTIAFNNAQVTAGVNGQVLVEIFPTGYTAATAPIFKFYTVKVVADNSTISSSYNITSTDTARALLYDAWTSSSTFTISDFNATAIQIGNVETEVINTLNANGSNYLPAFAWIPAVSAAVFANRPAAIGLPAISGYVYDKNGSALANHVVWLKTANNQGNSQWSTDAYGHYIMQNVTPGAYTVVPEVKTGYTFSPANYSVTVEATSALVSRNFTTY